MQTRPQQSEPWVAVQVIEHRTHDHAFHGSLVDGLVEPRERLVDVAESSVERRDVKGITDCLLLRWMSADSSPESLKVKRR